MKARRRPMAGLWNIAGLMLACVTSNVAAAESTNDECKTPREFRRGAWHVVETDDFWVVGRRSIDECRKVAHACEAMRSELHARWLGDAPRQPWRPKCQVVLHSSAGSYIHAVGRGGEATAGSSLVETRGGHTVRRIDLRVDHPDHLTSALPHELTHVVLSDRFPTKKLPRWADEGIAMLADSPSKLALHARDLNQGLARRATFALPELVNMSHYPAADRWGVFYGQSVSVVSLLVERRGPTHFVDFVERAMTEGYDAALRETYGIPNLGALDRLWRASLTSSTTAQPVAYTTTAP